MRAFFASVLIFAAMPAMATMPMPSRTGLRSCDDLISSVTAFRGSAFNHDGKGDLKQLVNFKNGKMTVNRDNPNFKSVEVVGGKTYVKFKEPMMVDGTCKECTNQGGIQTASTVTTLVFEESANGYVVKYNADPALTKSLDEANKEMSKTPYGAYGGMYGYGMGMGAPISQTAKVDKVDGQCEFNQDSYKNRMFGQDKETVIYDAKFCKGVENSLKEKGFENVSSCKNTFADMAKKFGERQKELFKENKAFLTSSTTGFGSFSGFDAVNAIEACSPAAWRDRWRKEFFETYFYEKTKAAHTSDPRPSTR